MFLYIIKFPNGKKYIGITTNINKRKLCHKSRTKTNDPLPVYCALRKYGFDNVIWDIKDGYKSWEELCSEEVRLILQYQTKNREFGYNITDGGDGSPGTVHSEKWKQAMSDRMSGENSPCFGRKLTPLQKQHLSEINTGALHPRYGKLISDYQKEKMMDGFIKYCKINGHPWGKNSRHSEEAKKKISDAHVGEKNGMYGKPSWNRGKKNPECAKRMSGSGNPMYNIQSEDHPRAKLNNEIVIEIREKYNSGQFTYKKLSLKYNVSEHTIANIVTRKSWKNI